jgi:hypothetical protein
VTESVRIGAGAGFSDDRVEPAVDLAERGDLDFIVFECLAERSMALRQLERRRDPSKGFDPNLGERIEAVLATCMEQGVRIVTNAGAANPQAAGVVVAGLARSLGLRPRVAVVTGDDVLETLDDPTALSANAYLGSAPIVAALDEGADVVLTGRIADASLFAAPVLHTHRWPRDDWARIAHALVAGHLLECAGQLTGGYFADPGTHDVPGLSELGFPYADVSVEGAVEVSKLPGSGGVVDARTCTQQLLYEVHDPARYVTPDAVVDLSQVELREVGRDRVAVSGVVGGPPPDTLKVAIGHDGGYIGEGEISYCGPGCVARAELAIDVVEQRLQASGIELDELTSHRIGIDGVRRGAHPDRDRAEEEPPEVRVRIAGRARTHSDAERIGREVTALWTNGPAGGGGARRSVTEHVVISSGEIARDRIAARVEWIEV